MSGMVDRIDVSIVVVNWNTVSHLRNCLESIFSEMQSLSFEVIVVDNGSEDDSVNMVGGEFAQVKLIENRDNNGYAAGCNQGIEAAAGRYVLLLNSDIVICDNAIEKAVAYADRNSDASIVGCQVREDSDKVRMTSFRFPSLFFVVCRVAHLDRLLPQNRIFGGERMLWWDRTTEREVDVISGMFMLVRREAIRDVGVMDEDYFLYYEETDWCYRFAKRGWKLLFWPGTYVLHVHAGGQSVKRGGPHWKYAVQFCKSQLLFFRKHRGVLCYAVVRALICMDAVARMVVFGAGSMLRSLRPGKRGPTWSQAAVYWHIFRNFIGPGLPHVGGRRIR